MRQFFTARSAVLSVVVMFGALAITSTATARGPYVILRDDGTIAKKKLETQADGDALQTSLLALYDATGTARPEVMSVWTTFPTNGSAIETLFLPNSNDIKGIGLEGMVPTASKVPPLRAMLLHNDVTQLAKRAQRQGASIDGFAEYLFLLELSHLWGPALLIPSNADAGSGADALTGFSYHWSFWMDAGGSPAGGNRWKDNGDGTFTAETANPKTMKFSMLDLYVMGLADPGEVTPFGLLENAVAPAAIKDPLFGGAFSARSFPWFGSGTFTAKAQRRVITIEDVIATNGKRSPARATSPSSWSLGIVLVVPDTATDEAVAAFEATFDPIASALAPRFHEATSGRGTLEVLTAPAVPADAGTPEQPVSAEDAGGKDGGPATPATPATTTTSGCHAAPGAPAGPWSAVISGVFAAVALASRRRVSRRKIRPA